MGFQGIGYAVAAVFTAVAIGSTTAFVIGLITVAVVGAAVGGIMAAVTGGDIGKGMLFGAVGSVVTVGTMGAMGLMTAPAGGTAAIGATGHAGALGTGVTQSTNAAAWSAAGSSGSGAVAGGVAGTGTAGMFGGAFDGVAPALVMGAAGALKDGPSQPWANTEEGQRAAWEQAEKMAAQAEAYSQNDAEPFTDYIGLEGVKGENALKQISSQMEEERKNITLKEQAALIKQSEEYRLANENTKAEFDRVLESKQAAGKAAGAGTYESGGNHEAILAAQKEREALKGI